ncbi:MAG TPA: zinc-binding dehydrogenase [Candidatus Acidoferrum sp.]|jgi:alcohol dehydrogenase/L-iditol 2-dehydrogenase|nr:zinc-binding dehydrogenase [Candidatus Acidoferrum sp.]
MAVMDGVVHYALEPLAVELREKPVPAIKDEEVLLKVGAVGVCGSDIHQYHNSQSWPVRVPVVLGHEFCGTVAEVGPRVRGFREGDRVVSETAANICGECLLCRTGKYNLCPSRSGFGSGTDGAMASFVCVPARCLHHIPDDLPFERAALTEPCCVAYNAVASKSTIRPGDTVVVIGPGPIGLLATEMARIAGARNLIVAGTTRDAARLEVARLLGATHTVDVQSTNSVEFIREIGDGLGADLVIDAAGVSAALKTALEMVRPGGQITKVGWGHQPLDFSLDPLVQKAIRLQGSFSHTFENWEKVVPMLARRQINLGPIITEVATLDHWKDCFDGMYAGKYVKAVLCPN